LCDMQFRLVTMLLWPKSRTHQPMLLGVGNDVTGKVPCLGKLFSHPMQSNKTSTGHQTPIVEWLNGMSAENIQKVQLLQEQARNLKQPYLANLWFLKTPSTAPQSDTTTPGKVQSCLSCFCSRSGLAHVGKPFTAL